MENEIRYITQSELEELVEQDDRRCSGNEEWLEETILEENNFEII